MEKPKFFYYNDARHYLMYRFDPPLSKSTLERPVDELLGTGVDTLAYGLASGQTFLHDTKVGTRWGELVTEHNHGIMWWRAAKSLETAISEGLDPLSIIIERAHSKGIRVIPSLRINDPATSEGPNANTYFFSKFKRDNPHVLIGGEGYPDKPSASTCLNFALKEVREERLSIIKEVCEDYRADGIEIDDYVRVFFEHSEIEKNTPVLTEFIREVRNLLDKIGQKQGRELILSCRANNSENDNLSVGMDVKTWVNEKLINAIILTDDSWQLNSHPNFEWISNACKDNDVWIYPHLGRVPVDDRYHHATIEMYRATASNSINEGADGMYLSDLSWPFGHNQYQVLRELGDADIYKNKSKHYLLPIKLDDGDISTKEQLPIILKENTPETFQIKVSDDIEFGIETNSISDIQLRIRVVQTGLEDRIEYKFNKKSISPEINRTETFYGGLRSSEAVRSGMAQRINTHYWFEFEIPINLVNTGENTIEVCLSHKLSNRVEDRVLESAELIINYYDAPTKFGGQM